jgi:hypothetical protein
MSEDGVADQDYGGEFRYVNKSPQELRRLLASETDPVERDAIEWTLLVFQVKGWAAGNDAKATTAGEPYRGEPKVAASPDSIREMVEGRQPVDQILVGDGLRRDSLDAGFVADGRGIPEAAKSGDGLGMVEGAAGIWEET